MGGSNPVATGIAGMTGALGKGVQNKMKNPFGFGQSTYQVGNVPTAPGPEEQEYISRLQDLAYGRAPSAANLQMQAGLGQSTAQAQALAASQRGINPALAARLAALSQSKMTQGFNQDSAVMRAQEQANAMGMLGNELQSVRTGQISGALGREQLASDAFSGGAGRKQQQMQGIMQGGAAALSMLASDERFKKNSKSGGAPVKQMLDNLSPKQFEYKNPNMQGAAPGQRVGVMAQDLEKTPAGASIVHDTSQGKMVDPAQGFGLVMAGLAELNQRLNQMEGKGMAHGGSVPGYSSGGMPMMMQAGDGGGAGGGGGMNMGMLGQIMGAMGQGGGAQADPQRGMPNMPNLQTIQMTDAISPVGQIMNRGYAHGGPVNMVQGGGVPGQAKVPGDSPINDTVDAKLSPEEIVIPRSIVNHPNAPHLAAAFVEGILANKKKDSFAEGGQAGGTTGFEDMMSNIRSIAPALRQLPQFGGNQSQPQLPVAKPEENSLIPSDQQIIAPQTMPSPSTQNIPKKSNLGGLGQMMSGMRQEANVMGQLGDQNAQVYDRLEKDQAMLNQRIESIQQKRLAESQRFAEDAKTNVIKPTQYLDNMDTGRKALMAISLFLGGMGAGPGGQNNALNFLNNQIDRDIEGQRQNMQQKNNLYKANMELYRDQEQATLMTKANLLSLAQMELQEQAARAQGPLAQSRAQVAMGQIQTQIDQLTAQAAQKAASLPPGGEITPEYAINFLMEKEDKKEATKELGALKGIQAKIDKVGQIIDKQFEQQSLSSRVLSPIQSSTLLDKSQGDLFPIVKSIMGEKMSDSDVRNMLQPMMVGFTDNKSTKEEKKKSLQQALLTAAQENTPTLQRYGQMYGADLAKVKMPDEFKIVNGVKYKKGPKGEAIPVK